VDDMFIAERGQGAYYNNRRIRVSARTRMNDALIGCGIPHLGKPRSHPRFLKEIETVMGQVSNVRRLGAAALDMCYVAAGRYDGYWERGIKSWDIAAGLVLIKEAGGFVTDCDGGQDMLAKGTVCAGNEAIQSRLLSLVKLPG
jgi:myo-inositol-1(or 4)-monophosphatase